jgi:nicotinamide-nucleotide amidase
LDLCFPRIVNIEIINTGTELMLGRVLNTHQQWLCSQLADLGCAVTRQVAIADKADEIQNAVREGLSRADLVITTGGLGPTSDDITRDLIAQLLGKTLVHDESIAADIAKFFAIRKRVPPASVNVQAMVPEGAIVFPNANGTAPGLAMEVSPNPFRNDGKPSWLVMLPGPPRELRPMFSKQVSPLIQKTFTLKKFVCRSLKTTGLGESYVEQRIDEPLKPLVAQGLELGYCARVGEVDVRLAACGEEATKIVDAAEAIVQQAIGQYIFSNADESLESVIVRLLTERKQTLSIAESCTGGLIAHRITNVSGASAVLMAGLVTYSNEAKQRLLGVREETLKEFGAVSEQTAREMAEGARERNKTDYALAVTGIAGPTGGTPEKPVGTVFVALATPTQTFVDKNFNAYERETFKFTTSQQALDLLRRRGLSFAG